MKNGKAPSPGRMLIKLIKNGPRRNELLDPPHTHTLNLFLRCEEILCPEQRTVYISMSIKKGGWREYTNYTGFTEQTQSVDYRKIYKSERC